MEIGRALAPGEGREAAPSYNCPQDRMHRCLPRALDGNDAEEAMATKPLAYMKRYQPVPFPGCGSQGQKYVRINRYISGDVMSPASYRTKAYKNLRSFVFRTGQYEGGVRGAKDHYYFSDTGYLQASDLKPSVYLYCPWDDVRQCFQGKGTPARYARVLQLCDYYLRHADIDISALGWGRRVTDLQEYADYYIGMDCNGFVGAYLEENFPGSGVSKNIDIDSIGKYFGDNASGAHFTRIDDATRIQTSDILVRRRIDGSSRHIALVESVISASSGKATLLIAESRGGDGLASRTEALVRMSKATGTRHWTLGGKQYDAVIRSR